MNELRDFIKSRSIVNLTIVALNILVFFIMEIGGDTENVGYMLSHGACLFPMCWKTVNITGCLPACSCTLAFST